jgi:hypothetical protein
LRAFLRHDLTFEWQVGAGPILNHHNKLAGNSNILPKNYTMTEMMFNGTIGGKSFFGTGDVQVNSNAQLFKSFGSPFLI